MNKVLPQNSFSQPTNMGPSTMAFVIALVAALHVVILFQLSRPARLSAEAVNELSISFAMTSPAPQAAIPQARKSEIKPVAKSVQPAPVQPVAQIEQTENAVESSAAVPRSTEPVKPKLADTEPVYQAAYLNNPPPSYPMVARRMGLQGRVVLNVEVLADGSCGQIKVGKSSGYAMLDSAALTAVKTWRFLPASQAGQAIDKWFMIPVQFSLKDNAA